MLAHKAWVSNLRTDNFAAAKEWLKVKDRSVFGDAEDATPRVIVEFATGPSPFIKQSVKPGETTTVQPEAPPVKQSVKYQKTQIKKKPSKSAKSSKSKTPGEKTQKSTKGTGPKS